MSNVLGRTFRFIMEVLTLFILFLCILSALNPFFGNSYPLFENCSTIQPITLLVCLFLLIFWSVSSSKWVFVPIISLIISIGYIGSVFHIPGLSKSESTLNNSTIKICSYNIHGFKYGKIDLTVQMISGFMRDNNVGILCLQEFDSTSEYNANSIKAQFHFLPYKTIVYSEQPGFALAVFSKYPILHSSRISFTSSGNQAMWSDLLVDSDTVRVFNLHMQTTNFNQIKLPIVPGYWFWDMRGEAQKTKYILDKLNSNFSKRLKQGEILSACINSVNYSVLVCCDMNANPASYSYYQIKGYLKDGFKTAGSGYEYTYRRLFNLFRTDYIFHSENFSGIQYKSFDLYYSDHKPVIMELFLNQ